MKKYLASFVLLFLIGTGTFPGQYVYPKDEEQTFEALGKPVSSLLIWENDEEFLKRCALYGVYTRMAGFQTTLPDPLPGEEFNVGLAAKMLAGTVVPPGKVFSLNQTLGPRTKERGFSPGPAYSGSNVIWVTGGGICKVSTTLYNTVILADLDVVERWPHGMLVPYVPPGQDATVSYGSRDFKFRNSTDSLILIWSEKVGNTLYTAFYGSRIPGEVAWHHQTLRRRPTYVIRKYSHRLRPGEKKIVQSGADGIWVKNWVTIRNQDGSTKTRNLGTDYYTPMPQIVETGY